MITNFENITHDLSEEEMKMVQPVIRGFKKRTKKNPITGKEICRRMKENGYNITEPRLRKITNYIRSNQELPVIATSKGYYVSHETTEKINQLISLYERIDRQRSAADGMRKGFIDVDEERILTKHLKQKGLQSWV